MARPPEYRVYALRYATRSGRRAEHFLGGDPHDGPMPMDYFVWAAIGPERAFVIDTGFEAADAAARNRTLLRRSGEALAAIGLAPAAIGDVIVTHMHYDHLGGFGQFPAARFHVQDREMAFATGRPMTQPEHGRAYTADHVAGLVHQVFAGRVAFHDGDAELAPGISLHHVGGHTGGMQVVRIHTRIGWIVLASDAAHYYENMDTARPFPIVWNLADVHAGYARCRALASDPAFVVPGHDPLVCRYYAPDEPGLSGIAHRLDAEPKR
jgi:glyoxylase-like metal-dependent hydrolase (beta-lactamase superfamily II)